LAEGFLEDNERSARRRMIPEDEKLCKHEYTDLYAGAGTHKNDPHIAIQAFYCTYCLDIRIKTYKTHNYAINRDLLEQYYEDNEGDTICE